MKLIFLQTLSTLKGPYFVGKTYEISEPECHVLIRNKVAKAVEDKPDSEKQAKVSSPVKLTKSPSVKAEAKPEPTIESK
jgi:hypothetical protein